MDGEVVCYCILLSSLTTVVLSFCMHLFRAIETNRSDSFAYAQERYCLFFERQIFKHEQTIHLHLHLHLHLVIWQTLLSKATYNWGIHKAIHLEEAIRQRKCS